MTESTVPPRAGWRGADGHARLSGGRPAWPPSAGRCASAGRAAKPKSDPKQVMATVTASGDRGDVARSGRNVRSSRRTRTVPTTYEKGQREVRGRA